jgi:hypothetical protein
MTAPPRAADAIAHVTGRNRKTTGWSLRLLPGAGAPAIKRLDRTGRPASKLAAPPAAHPRPMPIQ